MIAPLWYTRQNLGGFFMQGPMIKKVILSLLCITSLIQADHPIIVWDIHDVLLQPYDQFVSLLKFPHKRDIISRLSWPLVKDIASLLSQHLIREVSSEEYIHTAIAHGDPHLAELIVTVANSQRPMIGMQKLVKELHDLGIEQQIGSNIGKSSFYRLLDPEKYPHVASIFKYMNIDKSMVSEFENGTIIKKPDAQFFERYLAKNNIDLRHTPVIFIDDRWENVRVARSMGFDGIVFKNPNQLRIELRKRDIPVSIPPLTYSTQRDCRQLRDTTRFYSPAATS